MLFTHCLKNKYQKPDRWSYSHDIYNYVHIGKIAFKVHCPPVIVVFVSCQSENVNVGNMHSTGPINTSEHRRVVIHS